MLEQSKLRVFVGDHRTQVEWFTKRTDGGVDRHVKYFRNWSTAATFAGHLNRTVETDLGVVYLTTQVADVAGDAVKWLAVGNTFETYKDGTTRWSPGI
jgi:hypothetical protein